jgi:hypothetical protein
MRDAEKDETNKKEKATTTLKRLTHAATADRLE